MSGPNDFDLVVQRVLAHTQDNTVIVAMLMGAGLESNWKADAPGGGVFQITDAARETVRPGANAFTDIQVDSDVKYMLPRYQSAAAAHTKDPESPDKYANIAYDAERPAQKYQDSQGNDKVAAVYHTVLTNYGSANQNVSSTPQNSSPVLGFLQPVVTFLGDLSDIRLWRSLGWVALGPLLMILGLVIWFRKPIAQAATSAASVAKLAAA